MPTLVGTTTTGWSHATLWEMGFARRMAPQAPGIGTLTFADILKDTSLRISSL